MVTEQTATLRYLRMAPRKVRMVGNLIKGLSVNEAEAQLLGEPRRAARPLLKLLRSAVDGASRAKRLDPHKLYVASIEVNQGPMLKRSLPRARGMATLIQKKMSHVTLTLGERSTPTPPRFTIVVPKKVKVPEEERGKKRQLKETAEKAAPIKPKQAGFWRRLFRRKSV